MKLIPSFCLATALCCTAAPFLTAQNTILPPPLHTTYPAFTWDSTVFSDGLPAFALGHQWGASSLDKVNTTFGMNITSDNFGFMFTDAGMLRRNAGGVLQDPLNQLYHLGSGYRDTNYVMWGAVMAGMAEHHHFSDYWLGMRWEPAENAGYDATWTPRNSLSWPFSFAVRRHGTVPASQADVNYYRYLVVPETGVTYPVKVLDSAELRNRMCMRDVKVDWADDPIGSAITGPDAARDGRRLQVVVNLRRADSLDTATDDSVVVSLVVCYQMRWKDQEAGKPYYSPVTHRMPFDSIPLTSLSDSVHLPLGRGTVIRMRAPLVFTDSLVITRRMLPLYSDPGGPDLTIVAEFKTDTINDFDGIKYVRRKHILKTGVFDYSQESDAVLLANADSAAYNKRYHEYASVTKPAVLTCG